MSLRRLLTQTCTVRAYSGESAADGPVYSPAVTYPCRIEDGQELVRTTGGDEVVSSGLLFLPPAAVVPAESLVTANGRERVVLAVEQVYGRRELHHLQVRLR